jgi:DNA-binding transcriptional ArsR family regulator
MRGVPSARNTLSKPRPNRGGRPAQNNVLPLRPRAPAPSAEPIDDVVRTLIAECSGPEWCLVEELASIVGRKKDEVTEALKRLRNDGLVEDHKRADGRFEYRISGEPSLSKSENLESLQRNLDLANARIRELERLLRERDADFERQLHDRDVKIAQLEAQFRERSAEPPSSSVVAEADRYVTKQLERFEKEEAEQAAPLKPASRTSGTTSEPHHDR